MIFIYSLIHHSAVSIFYFHTFIILWSSFDGFITKQLHEVQWLVFIWLVAQMVEYWTRISEVKGLNPVNAWIFSGFLKDASKTTMILNLFVNCLQSVFSLKIRLVLISSSSIANHDVILLITIETRREKTDCYFFFLGLSPRFSPLASLGFACSNFAKKNKRLLAV